MMEAGQHPGLVGEPRRGGVIHRDLEHAALILTQVGHQEPDGGRARAEPPLQPEPAIDDRTRGCLQRIIHITHGCGHGLLGRGQ